MKDIHVVIGGAAGEGVQTIGDVLAKTVMLQGYSTFSWKEYESRIRGGLNSYSVRIGRAPGNAPLERAHILLALNPGASKKYSAMLHQDGVLITPNEDREGAVVVRFVEIAKKEFGSAIYANTVAAGALVSVLGIDLEALQKVLTGVFSKKGEEVVRKNHAAARKGFDIAEKQCKDLCPWELPKRDGGFYRISGNEAIPLAAAFAGCRFMSAYPMTPSTGIITFLSGKEERLKIFTEQAEDEIAAINMALGASYAGARAMTATSGGGFCLMVEGVSLAGMTETPIVIILAQRPGPATGLPTRTAQGDLLFAINAGHGEFPKLVLAPSDPRDAFHKVVRAFNLADKYQMPVIILTDQFLADAHFSMENLDLEDLAPHFFLSDPSQTETYRRYALTESGISPRLYPGQSEHTVCVDSDEHDEAGHITEDLGGIAKAMMEKRMAKIAGIKQEVSLPEEVNLENADTVFIGWGSSRGAILEAMESMEKEGQSAGHDSLYGIVAVARIYVPSRKKILDGGEQHPGSTGPIAAIRVWPAIRGDPFPIRRASFDGRFHKETIP